MCQSRRVVIGHLLYCDRKSIRTIIDSRSTIDKSQEKINITRQIIFLKGWIIMGSGKGKKHNFTKSTIN